jgi:hypothetical protein
MKLSTAQDSNLRWLAGHGGRAILKGEKLYSGPVPCRGNPVGWLHLVAKGLVDGADGELRITDYGRRVLNPLEKRCTCLTNQFGPDHCEVHAA